MIERAVITARDGRLDLDRAIPGGAAPAAPSSESGPAASAPARVRTAAELADLERDNLRLALECAGWKIAGAGGAAERLGLKPTTLASRMRALGIQRPG